MTSILPPNWKEIEFSDVVEDSAFGPRFSGDEYADDGNIAALRTTDMSEDGRIAYENMPRARLDESRFSKHFLQVGDLVISRSGRIGTTAVFGGFTIPVLPGAFCIRFRLKSNASPFFFQYLFNSPIGQQIILSVAKGTAQQNITSTNVLKLRIPCPPPDTQQRIADILSNYDHLIDNNARRIALLEESIHRLYKEWFVYLRFPGCDRVKVVDGVPEEWQKKSIENLIGFHMGGGWGKEEQEEKHSAPGFVIRGTDIPGISIGNISSVPFRYHQENNLRSRSLCDGDLIFEVSGGSKTHGVGRTLLVTENLLSKFNGSVMCASFCKVIRPIERDLTEYLWCLLLAERDSGGLTEYESQSASNIINFKFKEFLSNKLVLFPSTQILQKFNEFVRPPLEQIHNLGFQNQKLCEARDLLLPRLMNGSIPV